MDEIAEKLRAVVARFGPEALAVAGPNANTGTDNGLTRRFKNVPGSPNWIGVADCMGNTMSVNRMVYGWYPRADVIHSESRQNALAKARAPEQRQTRMAGPLPEYGVAEIRARNRQVYAFKARALTLVRIYPNSMPPSNGAGTCYAN